jgi:hypothetical protein
MIFLRLHDIKLNSFIFIMSQPCFHLTLPGSLGNRINPKKIFRGKFFWCMLFILILSGIWKTYQNNTMMFYEFEWYIKMNFYIPIMSRDCFHLTSAGSLGNTINPKNVFWDTFLWCMLFILICSSIWKNISK